MFINVYHHQIVDTLINSETIIVTLEHEQGIFMLYSGDLGSTTDKSGEPSALYNVVIGSSHFNERIHGNNQLKIFQPEMIAKVRSAFRSHMNDGAMLLCNSLVVFTRVPLIIAPHGKSFLP